MHIPYLQQSRTGIYYFRLVIPKALQTTVGRRELRRSLRTRDLPQAILRMRRYLDEVPYALQEHRLMFDLDKLKKAAARGSFELEDVRVGNVTIGKAKADPTVPGDVEALQETIQNLQNVAGVPETSTNLDSAPPHAPKPNAPAVGKISDYVDEYCHVKEHAGHWGSTTRWEHKPKFQLFIDIVGDRPVNEITRGDADYFLNTLRKLPANWKKRFGEKMDVFDAIRYVEQNRATEKRLVSAATVEKHKQVLNGFFRYLSGKKKLLPQSPFIVDEAEKEWAVKSSKGTKSTKYRRAFSPEELTRLFSVRQYQDDRYLHRHHYWLMLIGLHTGARLNEICQLCVSDVYPISDILVFDINDNDPEITKKTLKTPSSKRVIPVHSKLIELNIEQFVNDQKQGSPHDRLFPELKWYEKGNYGKYASKWFNSELKVECGFTTRGGVDFHAFRNTVASYLRNVGKLSDGQIGAILGHENGTIVDEHYADPYAVSTLRDFIEILNFDNSLTHVKPYDASKFKTAQERRQRK